MEPLLVVDLDTLTVDLPVETTTELESAVLVPVTTDAVPLLFDSPEPLVNVIEPPSSPAPGVIYTSPPADEPRSPTRTQTRHLSLDAAALAQETKM